MGDNNGIRVLSTEEISDVSETFVVKMKAMGLYPFIKDGKVKWGNLAQISFLQSLDTDSGKKVLKTVDKHSLPPSMRKQKRGIVKVLSKVPAQYVILTVITVLFGVVLVIMKFV
jgi:hypothetical protein